MLPSEVIEEVNDSLLGYGVDIECEVFVAFALVALVASQCPLQHPERLGTAEWIVFGLEEQLKPIEKRFLLLGLRLGCSGDGRKVEVMNQFLQPIVRHVALV